MARVELEMTVAKRWFFWPCVVAVAALAQVGFIRDTEAAVKWLAKHALTIKLDLSNSDRASAQ